MLTPHVVLAKEPSSFYGWLPTSYLLFFGIIVLVCLWAEVHRRRQTNKDQTPCACVCDNDTRLPLRELSRNFIRTENGSASSTPPGTDRTVVWAGNV